MKEAVDLIAEQGHIGLGTIAAISVIYLVVLFSVGYFGRRIDGKHPLAPWVFSFALSIYCTSWAFYGVTAQAAVNGWWIPPTYIGSFILFWFGFQLMARIAIACRRYRITSIADFIATRFGHSRLLAVSITLILFLAVIPYIALQLHAVSTSINVLVATEQANDWFRDTGLYVSLWMAAFALLFVSKSAKAHQPNPGLMTAIAFESLVKLLALLAIGAFVCFGIYDGVQSIFSAAREHPGLLELQRQALPTHTYWVHVLLGFTATLCLPRMFHVSFVENQRLGHLRSARWIFPLYLLLMSIFTLPLAMAGVMLLGHEGNIDLVVLQLPLAANRTDIALLAYLGGFSAATSMVVVATVVLGIMITNELLTPLLFRARQTEHSPPGLLKIANLRRGSMLLVLMLGFVYYRWIGTDTGLAQLGLMAFTLVAQLAPALILGLLSRQVNQQGALAGLLSGAVVWAYILLLPELSRAGWLSTQWLTQGPFGIGWLAPHQLFGWQVDAITLGVLLSLSCNLLMVLLVSQLTQTRVGEWLESGRFLQKQQTATVSHRQARLSMQDCYLLLRRFAGESEANRVLQRTVRSTQLEQYVPAPANLLQASERALSAVIGGASMRLVMDAASRHSQLPLETVARFVDEASQVFQFNQALLQATIDNISQGISVVDADLRLIAWNQRYLDMFAYPPGLVEVGRPVADLIRFNAERGLIHSADVDSEVEKRLSYLRQGSSYKFQRPQKDGRVFEMQGNPLPGGGFVTTFTDVSSFIDVQQALEQSNLTLEQRVADRTRKLETLNQQLQQAQQKIEASTQAKTRFFAAAGHDLMQPFNAAALFAGLLREKADSVEQKQLSEHLISSLDSAEELLTSILELTKLDAGVIKAHHQPVALRELLDNCARDAAMLAAEKGLTFHYLPSKLAVTTDRKLLKRVIQNLLANAIRYTDHGRIVLGCKRYGETIEIRVIDTGIGIAPEDQQRIFEEFQQGDSQHHKGLGLGLAIAHRITGMLQHPLMVHSAPDRGSCFSIRLPLCRTSQMRLAPNTKPDITASFAGKSVLLLDNDERLLQAVTELLRSWDCQVHPIGRPEQALQAIRQGITPDILLFDYHLDNGATGVMVAEQLSNHFSLQLPVIIHSADHSEQVREYALNAGFHFLLKPLKPMALKRLFQRLLR
ncbi:PAS domain-containing hybrid sensor histidine kinase/response regulator [Alkalimonas sp. NCh-2]|uniref:PAS domain-containing hybrid sensor histidine kinase/response regulator n=1 Tax=Alkalimonas sp. NCh-2 TaxID=3144846 RepID=UPI0031F6DE84